MPAARIRTPLVVALVTAGILLCAFGLVAALHAWREPCGDEEIEERTLHDNVKAAGNGGYGIILLAATGIALALVLAVRERRGALLPSRLVSQLEQALSSGDVDKANVEKAKELCVERSRLRNVLFAGLSRVDAGREAAARAVELAAQKERIALRRSVGWLLLLAIAALLIGAVSTVSEFMWMFDWIAMGRSCNPGDFADSCVKAFIPSFMGLVAATVLVPAWWLLRSRGETLAHEIEATADDLVSRVAK